MRKHRGIVLIWIQKSAAIRSGIATGNWIVWDEYHGVEVSRIDICAVQCSAVRQQ